MQMILIWLSIDTCDDAVLRQNSNSVKSTDSIKPNEINRYSCNEQHDIFRDATKEELEGVDQYIKFISKSTGIDFFALC